MMGRIRILLRLRRKILISRMGMETRGQRRQPSWRQPPFLPTKKAKPHDTRPPISATKRDGKDGITFCEPCGKFCKISSSAKPVYSIENCVLKCKVFYKAHILL